MAQLAGREREHILEDGDFFRLFSRSFCTSLGTTKHHIINKIMAKRKMSANKIPVTVLTGRWNNLLF